MVTLHQLPADAVLEVAIRHPDYWWKPVTPAHSVCIECKRAGNVCVMVAHGTPCLGPVTQAGCGALCPSYARGCYGCFGPRESANGSSLASWFERELGLADRDVAARFAGFPSIATTSSAHGASQTVSRPFHGPNSSTRLHRRAV